MQLDEPTDDEREGNLPNDFDPPFTAPEDEKVAVGDDESVPDVSPLTSIHPNRDANIQPEEEYDEGLSGAAEAQEPNAGDTVVGYDPQKDKRRVG